MHTRLVSLLLLIGIVANSQAQQSLCDKYASLLTVNGYQLIETVVNGTVASVVQNTATKPYFDGSLDPYQTPGITNYTDPANAAKTTMLSHSLTAFFYSGLNCTDNSGQQYNGPSMKAAHAKMPIGPMQFESFNRQLIAVLQSKGVQDADLVTILGVLNSFKGDICNQPSCNTLPPTPSICDKYTSALNSTSYYLVSLLVDQVFVNITSPTSPPSPLLRFFNGVNGPNYLDAANATALAALKGHLNQFFGSALSCSGTYPTYTGRTLYDSHKGLPIDKASFDLFNQVLIGVLAKYGVVQADRDAVLGVLNGTQKDVCTLCSNSTVTTGGSGSTTGAQPSTTNAKVSTTTSAAVVVVPAFIMAVVTFIALAF